jgi:hypothetical protein
MILVPEYGARVKLDERYEYPTNGGTIVGYTELDDDEVWTIVRDFDGQECNYVSELFTVSMSPTLQAQQFLARWDIDTALETMENIFAIGAQVSKLERYQSALIYAFYRIHYYLTERPTIVVLDITDEDGGGWDSGTCDDGYGDDWDSGTGDDGYGYPVYSVED